MRSFQPLLLIDLLETTVPGISALASQETGTLESGTFAFVNSVKTLYVLDKDSTVNATGGIVAAQGGGRWIPQSSVGSSFSSAGVRNTSDKAATLSGVNSWATLPGGANNYAATFLGGNWGLSTTTGKLTWNGPNDQPFLVTASAYGYENTTVADVQLAVGINESAQPWFGQVSAPVATGASAFFGLSISGVTVLDQGQTLDFLVAGESSVWTITKMLITATPLS